MLIHAHIHRCAYSCWRKAAERERRLYPPPSRQSRQLNKRLAPAVFPTSFWNGEKLAIVSPRKQHAGRRVFVPPQKRREEVKNKQQSSKGLYGGKEKAPSRLEPRQPETERLFVCLFSQLLVLICEKSTGMKLPSCLKPSSRKRKEKLLRRANIQKWKYRHFNTTKKKRKEADYFVYSSFSERMLILKIR